MHCPWYEWDGRPNRSIGVMSGDSSTYVFLTNRKGRQSLLPWPAQACQVSDDYISLPRYAHRRNFDDTTDHLYFPCRRRRCCRRLNSD
jgi:hypothetical protein